MRFTAVKEVNRQQAIVTGTGTTGSLFRRMSNRPHPAPGLVNAGRADTAVHLGNCERRDLRQEAHKCFIARSSPANDARYSATRRRWHLSAVGSVHSKHALVCSGLTGRLQRDSESEASD